MIHALSDVMLEWHRIRELGLCNWIHQNSINTNTIIATTVPSDEVYSLNPYLYAEMRFLLLTFLLEY